MHGTLHFTILAPHYTPSSNGAMAIYQLGEILESLGHQITFVPIELSVFQDRKCSYPAHLLAKFETDPARTPTESIAVFPETTPEHLVQVIPAKYRVWYLLNKPYILTGKLLAYRPDDLLVAYSGLISKILYNLFLTREITELASGPNALGKPREKEPLILLYIGKSKRTDVDGAIKKLVRKHRAKVVVINRSFPNSRETLFDLLHKARLLVSYDPLTNLNYEATLCGTPCYIVDNYMRLKYEDFNLPLHGFFEDAQLLENYYQEGIAPALLQQIQDRYLAAQQESLRSVQGFVQLCQDWFTFVDDAQTDPFRNQLLIEHNALRKQVDEAEFALSGKLQINAKLQHPTDFLSLTERIKRRKARITWNVRRTWYKHVLRLHGEKLENKLNAMRACLEKNWITNNW